MTTYTITAEILRDKSRSIKYPGVTQPGQYTYDERHNRFFPVAQHEPIQFDDISSGLGIGGAGSDDCNIHTKAPGPHIPKGRPRRNGGGQLWEPCPRCGEEPVHTDCGYCDRHCQC